jgi:acetylornithine deacetylase
MAYNLVVAATAEEETSGDYGLNSLLKTLPAIDTCHCGRAHADASSRGRKGLGGI